MFRIVFICSGNQCRSPAAEAFMRERTAELPVEVTSAGTLEIVGRPSPDEMVAAARAHGADLASHRSRGLRDLDLPGADLVLGFERRHVATAVVDGGAAPEKAFMVRELARLLRAMEPVEAADPEERARAVVVAAHGARLAGASFVPGEDVGDPIGGSPEDYTASAREIWALCADIATCLFGPEDR